MDDFAELNERQLLSALDTVEAAISSSTTFERYANRAGQVCERVSPQLLALAEREQLIVTELRRRTTVPHRS